MTPKEKAEDLINTHYDIDTIPEFYDTDFVMRWDVAKRLAIITVNAIIEEIKNICEPIKYSRSSDIIELSKKDRLGYWQEVQNELNKF